MKHKINCPFLDRRVKLLPCQLERIAELHKGGTKIADIHRHFNQGERKVGRKTIEFFLHPSRQAAAREVSKKTAKPVNKELVAQRTKNTRNYLKSLLS